MTEISRRQLLQAAVGLAVAPSLESPLARLAQAMVDPNEQKSLQQDPEVLDYDNGIIVGEISAQHADSIAYAENGRLAFSTHSYTDNKNVYNVQLGTTQPEGNKQQLEIYTVDPVDSSAIVQPGIQDKKIYASFVNMNNEVIVRPYDVDFQAETDINLGTWLGEEILHTTPLQKMTDTYTLSESAPVQGGPNYWVGAFSMLEVDGKQMIAVANEVIPAIESDPNKQPIADFKMIIADPESGEQIRLQSSSPVRELGEVAYYGDSAITQIVKEGKDVLAVTKLGVWRSVKDEQTGKWSTNFEKFIVPQFWRKEFSLPHSLAYDAESGDIIYATSLTDIYCGVLKRDNDGTSWTSTENQLVLERTDDEPWNGLVGDNVFAKLPMARPNGSDDVVLMVPGVWFGPPFNIQKLFGIVQEPILYRNGKFMRTNKNRQRGKWELFSDLGSSNATVLSSNLTDNVLQVNQIDYKGLHPRPTPTSTPIPTPTPQPTPVSRRALFLPRVSK